MKKHPLLRIAKSIISVRFSSQLIQNKNGIDMDYSRFMNPIATNRQCAPLREMYKVYARAPPDMIFMAGGSPNTTTFPFAKITFDLKDGTKGITLEGQLLDKALQYMGTMGYMPLSKKLKDWQTRVHKLAPDFWETRDLVITSGSQDAVCKAMEMCLQMGDPVMFAVPAYSGAIEVARPYKPRWIAAVQDEFGVYPRRLREALEKEGTPEEIRSKRTGVPKLLYVNPTGSNPSGATYTTERKREVYRLACEYDFLIIEDDPYYFVNFEKENPVSFLSLDTQGRVLRMDSFSKIVSSGIRLGFLTAPKPLLQRIELHMEISNGHTSGLPQVMIDEMLSKWGQEGLEKQLLSVKNFYQKQRDACVAAAEKYLTGLAEWTVPKGGMFLWMKLIGIKDASSVVGERGLKDGVLLLQGQSFMLDDEPCPYVRASYSLATPEQMDKGFFKFAQVLKTELVQQRQTRSFQNGVAKFA